MRASRVLATAVLALGCLAVVCPPAHGEDTVLIYSIREARAFLEHIAYPQTTFISENYGPCDETAEFSYGCDRGRYDDQPNCPKGVGLGLEGLAPETPDPAAIGSSPAERVGEEVPDEVRGNPVTVEHGLALAHLASTPESGGLASMYYVDNSGRRETLAHAESDGYVSNRHTYEERCAVVDAFSESDNYPILNSHVLSRSGQGPSTYNMAAFTTPEAPATPPPGGSKESVSIVSLYEQAGRVYGLLSSTVRGLSAMEGMVTVDVVRTVIQFSTDGTESGLEVDAKSEALGVKFNGNELALPEGTARIGEVTLVNGESYPYQIGLLRPVVKVSDGGRRLGIWAGGLFFAATTPLDKPCIPENPFKSDPFNYLCAPVDPLNGESPFPSQIRELQIDDKRQITLGGKMFRDQADYVAGAVVNATFGRVPPFNFNATQFASPPLFAPPVFAPLPLPAPVFVPQVAQPVPVALPTFRVREIAGSPWPLASIVAGTLFGLLAVGGRWSMRFAWARALSRQGPFPAFGWAYRAFLKD